MKSMTYAALEIYGYDNVLVIKYFCTTIDFSSTYVRTYRYLSNPAALNASQPAIKCSKLIIETLEQGVKCSK